MSVSRLALFGLLVAASASAQAGVPFRPIDAAPGTVFEGRCHMRACVFTKFVSSTAKARPGKDLVVEVVQQMALASDDDIKDVIWSDPSKSSYNCSYVRPQATFSHDGETTVHDLTLSPQDIVAGYQVHSALEYFRACHNFSAEGVGLDQAIVDFGYDVIAE